MEGWGEATTLQLTDPVPGISFAVGAPSSGPFCSSIQARGGLRRALLLVGEGTEVKGAGEPAQSRQLCSAGRQALPRALQSLQALARPPIMEGRDLCIPGYLLTLFQSD